MLLQWKFFQSKTLAISWIVIISILFFLPGSTLPKEGWLSKIYFDKWVHIGFFTVLLFLWRFYLPSQLKFTWLILAAAFCYGLSVELIQHYLITNRSFDIGDLIADMIGAVTGILVWKFYKKNRPL